MTKSVRATTCSPKVSQGVHAFSFRFRLRSLFFVTAVCAILSALYAYFGNAVILPLLLGAAACLAVIFIIDTSLAIRDIFIGNLRRRSFRDEQDRDGGNEDDTMKDGTVENLRLQEDFATARYNVRTGPLEDVLRARAVRLQAEIRLLRENAARRQSRLLE